MTEEIRIRLNNESLTTLLRSNICCHMGKVVTQEVMAELTQQIIDSIEYFLNKKDEVSQ